MTSGAACDVPDMYWYHSPRRPFATSGVCPPKMSTPGAVTSGFKKFASDSDGPREEKSATTLPSPGTDAKMPRASRTVTSSSSVSIVVVLGVGGEPVDELFAVGVADHDGGNADAARIAVHDDRRPGVVVDDDGDGARVLGVARS